MSPLDYTFTSGDSANPPSGTAHSFHHRTPSPYHHHVPIHLGEINTFIETIQLWLHSPPEEICVCRVQYGLTQKRNSWLLSFFRKQRAEEKCLFCLLFLFFSVSELEPHDFATFWPQSHSSEMLVLGEGSGLCTITGDEPEANKTVEIRLSGTWESHHESVSLPSPSFPFPISVAQPGKSFKGVVQHFGNNTAYR